MSTNLKYDTLKTIFPGECSVVGEANVNNIISGPVESIRATGGSNLDISQIVSILINAAAFTDAIINIYNFLKEKDENSATVNNISINIINNPQINIELSEIKKEKIIRYIVDINRQPENI
ncbi:hypothetical protein [Spirosoma foliorum]|uniref:Uncharacterized protein n=1 Tax=Spirosoma foliorum TaxID=2710596 RepID=A0A7G5H2U3_9BACT|nr:hypothetical protein [Spirosoma foliorum]QMW05435.1 hypothetical protein H3H32_11355 [Spirosoma foliorum]